jgi:hypothetical protein
MNNNKNNHNSELIPLELDSILFNLQEYLDAKEHDYDLFMDYDIDMIVTHDLYYDLSGFCDF